MNFVFPYVPEQSHAHSQKEFPDCKLGLGKLLGRCPVKLSIDF